MDKTLKGEGAADIPFGVSQILNGNKSNSPRNYILRITREEWFRQVFSIKKYFPGVPRRWEPGGVILLVRKAEKGDSFVGYGVLGEFVKKDDLPEDKKQECEKMGWKGVLVFNKLYRFEPPLPIKETVLSGLKARGRCLHGYPLTEDQVNSILRTAKEKTVLQEV